jgi:hypothetical protein
MLQHILIALAIGLPMLPVIVLGTEVFLRINRSKPNV